jgi:hypothetical protein
MGTSISNRSHSGVLSFMFAPVLNNRAVFVIRDPVRVRKYRVRDRDSSSDMRDTMYVLPAYRIPLQDVISFFGHPERRLGILHEHVHDHGFFPDTHTITVISEHDHEHDYFLSSGLTY